jgi:LPXTG-motif cell wall-anchored protein
VTEPPSTASVGTDASSSLPFTGSATWPLGSLGAALVLAGVGGVVTRRRRVR